MTLILNKIILKFTCWQQHCWQWKHHLKWQTPSEKRNKVTKCAGNHRLCPVENIFSYKSEGCHVYECLRNYVITMNKNDLHLSLVWECVFMCVFVLHSFLWSDPQSFKGLGVGRKGGYREWVKKSKMMRTFCQCSHLAEENLLPSFVFFICWQICQMMLDVWGASTNHNTFVRRCACNYLYTHQRSRSMV